MVKRGVVSPETISDGTICYCQNSQNNLPPTVSNMLFLKEENIILIKESMVLWHQMNVTSYTVLFCV